MSANEIKKRVAGAAGAARDAASAVPTAPAQRQSAGAVRAFPMVILYVLVAFAAGWLLRGQTLPAQAPTTPKAAETVTTSAAEVVALPFAPKGLTLASTYTQSNVAVRAAQVEEYRFPRHVNHENLFSPAEIERILKETDVIPFLEGTLGSKSLSEGKKGEARRAQVKGIPKEAAYKWIYQRVFDAVTKANEANWQFALGAHPDSLLVEVMQISKYDDSVEGHYDWHRDTGYHSATAKRRVSVTVQLTDPKTYEGGELQIKDAHNDVSMPRTRGNAVFFPSFEIHRVKPVTKGTRYSLVAWYQTL